MLLKSSFRSSQKLVLKSTCKLQKTFRKNYATEEQKKIVGETAKIIDPKAITTCFYARMFKTYPETKCAFNQSHQRDGSQQTALADAVVAYATNLNDLSVLGPAVQRIAEKHVSLDIRPEQYPIVGENLLAAIKQTHGVGEDILDAWGAAYGDLAKIFVDLEEKMYAQNESTPGGWRGFKKLTVSKLVKENHNVMSVYFTGDAPFPGFKGGYYVSVKVPLQDEDGLQIAPRSYTLTDITTDYLRISVRHEKTDDCPAGIYSSYIHNVLKEGDQLEVSFPMGESDTIKSDVLDNKNDVLLLSGGIGVTDTLSLAKYLRTLQYPGRVTMVQSISKRNDISHVKDIQELEENENFKAYLHITDDNAQSPNETEGRINEEALKSLIEKRGTKEPSFYLCGSNSFIKDVKAMLVTLGIPTEKIHFHLFAPLDSTI